MAFKCNYAAAAALLALLVVAWTAPAQASTLTVFAGGSGPGCSGKTKDIQGCGCFDLAGYQSGYHFVFTEDQEAILYTDRRCRNRYNPVVLDWETRYCRRFPYKSVELVC